MEIRKAAVQVAMIILLLVAYYKTNVFASRWRMHYLWIYYFYLESGLINCSTQKVLVLSKSPSTDQMVERSIGKVLERNGRGRVARKHAKQVCQIRHSAEVLRVHQYTDERAGRNSLEEHGQVRRRVQAEQFARSNITNKKVHKSGLAQKHGR